MGIYGPDSATSRHCSLHHEQSDGSFISGGDGSPCVAPFYDPRPPCPLPPACPSYFRGCRGRTGRFMGHIRFQNAPGATVDHFGGRATLEAGSAGATVHAWAGSSVVIELNGTGAHLDVHAGNATLRVLLHSSDDRGAASRVFVHQALGLTVIA